MMGVTVVAGSRNAGVGNSAVGNDAAFLARATSICQAGLTVVHAPVPAAMSKPGDTSALARSALRSAAAVENVERELRAVPVSAKAALAVDDWLNNLGHYVADEQQLAVALGVPTGGGATRRASGATAAQQAAMRVNADITRAGSFTGSSALSACSLAPTGRQPPLVPIP